MRFPTLTALVVRLVHILFVSSNFVLAHDTTTCMTSTLTLTVTSTITRITSTVTLTRSGSVFESVTTRTATIGPAQTGSAAYSGSAFEFDILNSTNYHRAHHQANPVIWNTTLASFAQSYAERCLWQHSGGPYGENLAVDFAGPVLAVDAWGDEEATYNYEKPKFSEQTGHYTQLVWKGTTSVGCGAVKCDNNATHGAHGWLLVCEYSPRGNIDGLYGQNVGKPGIGKDGKLGFSSSADPGTRGGRLVGALATAYLILAMLA